MIDTKIGIETTRIESYRHVALWLGAITVGVAAVLYSRLTSLIQHYYFSQFERHPLLLSLGGPFFFLAAAALVRRYAPDAKGSGIPQVLEAMESGNATVSGASSWSSSLVSIRTAVIKVFSSAVGLFGGASIGREGPTVQIAASVYAAFGRRIRSRVPNIELAPWLTAGAAAGVAAAFNTPLAGITFAIEEVAGGALGPFRQAMMISVILSGIVAQALSGDYLYFGHPDVSSPGIRVVYESVLIGIIAGLLGGVFARMLAYPKMTRLPKHWMARAFLCGLICSVIGFTTHGSTAGSGYEPTEAALMAHSLEPYPLLFPLFKLMTTALSYLSGMAGGIFSPSLSIGAGVGIAIAKLFHFANFRACALMGMVAFFSGVVQAPLTAVIIVTEMTDRHILIIPFMISAFIGQGIGRRLMPVPLYHYLAKRHQEA